MRSNKTFANISEFINSLNSAGVNYLILRNFENLTEKNFLLEEHPDIDMLTDDIENIINATGAIPSHSTDKYGDKVHFYVEIANTTVSLDLRSLGDGYFCKKWEENMLKNRVLTDVFFTPSSEDYFYSLLYHAFFQKETISHDYIARLSDMAKTLHIDLIDYNQKQWISRLEQYMKQKGYTFTYCTDYHVPLYHRWNDNSLFHYDWQLALRHWIYDSKLKLIEFAVKIKHALKSLSRQ